MDRESTVKRAILNILGRYTNEFKGVSDGLCAIHINQWWGEVSVEGLKTRFYNDFWEFVEDEPPFGCGADRDIIEAICKRVDDTDALELLFPEKYMSGKIGQGTRTDLLGDNVTKSRGNNPQYKLNRLKRERPEIAERVIAGEISANAGVIEAGFANKKMTVPLIKEKVVGWILKYFNEDDIEYIKNNL